MFRGNRPILHLALAGFLAAFQGYLIAYTNSSLITERIGSFAVSPLYMAGAGVALVGFLFAARILRAIGARWFLSAVVLCKGVALLALAGFTEPTVTAAAFIVDMATAYMMWFVLDIFIEHATICEGMTGRVRGLLLTVGNSALIVSPLITASILEGASFGLVYLVSAGFLMAFVAFILPLYGTFRDPEYIAPTLASLRGVLRQHKDLLPTVGAQLMLSIFYSFAAIYMPLYLLDLGFSWREVSVILTIGLLPFVLVELPIGRLADKYLGEKEILLAGFVILIAATSFLALPFAPSVALYAALLFTTRFGAAMVEVTAETHFFRAVEAKDGVVITLSRMMGGFGYLIGAGLAGLILLWVPLHEAFLFFGLLLLPGLYFASRLRDSR